MDGALGTIYRDWADRLRGVLAYQEALIDFPDEDLPPDVEARLLATLRDIRGEIAAHLDDRRRGEKLRDGLFFAITGAPNVGKSALINALADRDVAIVSPVPGTTRDVLETRVILGGVPVTLLDTAGLRETSDPIEAEGVRRARMRLEDADLVLTLIEVGEVIPDPRPPGVLVVTKVDLAPETTYGDLQISVLTGQGMAELRDRLSAAARSMTESNGPPALTQARHRSALQDAAGHLDAAERADLPELRGEDLRLALRSLGRITGHVGVEDILDAVFSRFCIGK
jgi:tRNA modification GTPase